MVRPRSDDKKEAILTAATRIIATQGLAASTASIAKAAGVANGSLFTYFPTKADLLNHLYVELKTEMATVGVEGLPTERNSRGQMHYVWMQWLEWGTTSPDKRKALAHLGVSEDLTDASRKAAGQAMAGVAALLEQVWRTGPMRDAPPAFLAAIMSAIGDTAIDAAIRDPIRAQSYGSTSFEAFWRMIT